MKGITDKILFFFYQVSFNFSMSILEIELTRMDIPEYFRIYDINYTYKQWNSQTSNLHHYRRPQRGIQHRIFQSKT